AVSQLQRARIEHSLKNMSADLRSKSVGKLTVYYYDAPAAVRAVLIDERTLAFGWYIYTHTLCPNPDFPNDKFDLLGHDAPGIVCYRGSAEFEVLLATFKKLQENYDSHSQATGARPAFQFPLAQPAIQMATTKP